MHAGAIVRRLLDEKIAAIEVSEAAEARWAQAIRDRSTFDRDYIAACTPSYYNAEGKNDDTAAFSTAFGGGPFEYIRILAEWRADGLETDTELRQAGQVAAGPAAPNSPKRRAVEAGSNAPPSRRQQQPSHDATRGLHRRRDPNGDIHNPDEGVRYDATPESMGAVPLLKPDGVVTEATASQTRDGATPCPAPGRAVGRHRR